MTPATCYWIILVVGGVLVAPAQGRRVRHASWLTAGTSRCARCPPGWGVERRCESGGPDTACTPCREGEAYSAHHSARTPCLLCSRCGPGLFAARECTATRDTHCAACSPPPPPHRRNQDYHRRCGGLRADEDAEDGGQDDGFMLADAPVHRHRAVGEDDDDDVREHDKPHGPALARYGLSQSTLLPARSKSDMARSILADPGSASASAPELPLLQPSRLPHVLLADDETPPREEYSLLQHQEARAGPAYSVLTDDGPVAPAAPEPRRRHGPASPRPPPPRYPVRLSSPITWGRPSAPSVNTRQAHGLADKAHLSPPAGPPLPLHRGSSRPDDVEMSAEEVGRLML